VKRVHVSLHDVCALFKPELDAALELCERVGVRPALLVVPDFHGRGSLRRTPAFVDKLKRLVDRGSEIFDPLADRAQRSLVLNFATRSRMRLHSSIAFTRWARPLSRLLPARIALHPGDVRSQLARREVERLLRWGRGSFVAGASELFT
jgi:hypothetical protein